MADTISLLTLNLEVLTKSLDITKVDIISLLTLNL